MTKTHTVQVQARTNEDLPLVYKGVHSITLIDDASHGPAAIGRNLETGEVRLLISSPAVLSVRIEAT